MVFFGLLCVAVVFGSQALSYTTSVKSAESSFEQRDYKNAYDSLAGVSVSDSSKELKQKVRMCMQLQREYDAYQNYYKMKMYLESLDSLIGGIRLYDANKSKAEQYDMLSQYNELRVNSQINYTMSLVSVNHRHEILLLPRHKRNTQTACRRFFCSGRREMKRMRDNEKIADRFFGRLF